MCLGIPGRIDETHEEEGLLMGTVDFGGVQRDVCLACVGEEVGVGDYVIVHVGFAIAKVDEEEARRTLDLLRDMAGPQEERDGGQGGSARGQGGIASPGGEGGEG